MCTLFKGKTYVIGIIKRKEIKEVIKIAKDLGLGIMYPEMFVNVKGNLHRVAISDDRLGGYVPTIVCWQELTVKKSSDWGYFSDVKELKAYIAKVKEEQKKI